MKLYFAFVVGVVFVTPLFRPAFAEATTIRVSVASDGTQQGPNYGYSYPALSADGQYVAFGSPASNLVANDLNNTYDVFRHDTKAGTTICVSAGTNGIPANGSSMNASISADGRFVSFDSTASAFGAGVAVCDTAARTVVQVAPGSESSISADGKQVAFYSYGSHVVPNDTNGVMDVFVRDLAAGTTKRVSVSSGGTQGNGESGYGVSLSANGRYVAFETDATNLVAVDTNGCFDVVMRDRLRETTTMVSVSTDGLQGNQPSYYPAVSADGRYVAFMSDASNLVVGDTNGSTDVFVRDTIANTTVRASSALNGGPANGGNWYPSISADGRYVAFVSRASNLVSDDTNGCDDVFVRDLIGGATTRVSISSDGSQSNGGSDSPAICADGRYVAFESTASNLVSGDTNGAPDVFLRGPLTSSTKPPFTLNDIARSLRYIGGLVKPTSTEAASCNVETSNPAITLTDAIRIARKVAGLEANP